MAITLTNLQSDNSGYKRRVQGLLTFDTAYPKGGYTVTPQRLGLGAVDYVDFPGHGSGAQLYYDPSSQKLHVRRSGSVVVIEDTGTFTAGAAYTMHMKPAYILAIRGTGGSTGTKRLIPNGKTLSAGQCSINFTTGVVSWGDATITAAVIMYIPLGVPGFTSDLLVVDELVTLADATGGFGAGDLASRAACINYVWNNEDSEVLTYQPVGENPGANQVTIDILNTAATTLRVLTSDIGNGASKLMANYIKYNAAVHDRLLRWLDQGDIALATNVAGPGTGATAASTRLDGPSVVIPGFGQCVVGEISGGNNAFATFVDPGATAANDIVILDQARNTWTGNGTPAFVTFELPVLYVPAEVGAGTFLDVPFGEDLSHLTAVPFVAVGF